MKQWINALHKLFDPKLKSPAAEQFSLKHPGPLPEEQPDLTVQTQVQVPGLDPLARLQARTDSGMIEVSRALDLLGADFAPDFSLNLGRVRQALRSAHSPDVIFREFALPFSPPLRACLVFIDGVVDANEVDLSVLAPLMSR